MTEPKHKPVSEEAMLVKWNKLSICQVIRQVYERTEDPVSKEKLRLACGMAKDMSKKIGELSGDEQWYRKYWDDNMEGE